ncbi:ribosomal protein [Salix suchowensis]|nr:ribosomal protein [Salix suchowensis]
MSRQAKNLVSFSSRISSFSYSQSRSFTAAPPPPPSVFVDKKESRTKMPTISSSSGRNAGGHQEEKPPKAMTTKICIAIRSFEDLVPGNTISGLPADVRKIRLPESRVLYTVLRSPHVDKKSREQFEMRMKKQLLVAKVQSHELRNKYFWLKRQRIFGAQYEIQFHCKTRLEKGKTYIKTTYRTCKQFLLGPKPRSYVRVRIRSCQPNFLGNRWPSKLFFLIRVGPNPIIRVTLKQRSNLFFLLCW